MLYISGLILSEQSDPKNRGIFSLCSVYNMQDDGKNIPFIQPVQVLVWLCEVAVLLFTEHPYVA